MPSYQPPLKNSAYVFYVSLVSQANTKIMQASATLASGDVKSALDDAAPANLATLPVVDADYTKRIKVSLSAAEMNGDRVTVIFSDASGAEWCDLTVDIATVTNQFDSLATQASVNTIDDLLDSEIGTLTTNVAAILADTGTDGVVVNAAGLATDAVTEIQSGLATAASIAALNNLSAAQVNTEVDTALADYDAPTKAELDAGLAALNDISVADILAGVIEGSITLKGALRLALSALTGKASGGGTTTISFRDTDDTKARITATVDSSGNRTAVTRDITD